VKDDWAKKIVKQVNAWVKCCKKCPRRFHDQAVCNHGKPYDTCDKYNEDIDILMASL